jgi:DNA-binding winged helix-turn-helix (wHTH) protein/TolB-like protein
VYAGSLCRFGPFAFDTRGRVLFRDGRDLLLPPKAAETLALLLASAGQVVDRTTLHDSVWAGKIVGDGSLTRTISILRRALGGNDASQAYIATVSKRGYRFVAPLDFNPDVRRRMRPTLAVLPFENLGSGPTAGAFCRGLDEEILTALIKLAGERVGILARGPRPPMGEPVRAPGADHLLEGTLRRNGTRLRVTARLIRSTDQNHRWAEQYERGAGDALSVQCELAQLIAATVVEKLDRDIEAPQRRRGDRPMLKLV